MLTLDFAADMIIQANTTEPRRVSTRWRISRRGDMSDLPPIADIGRHHFDVRFVPEADISPPIRSPHRRGQAAWAAR